MASLVHRTHTDLSVGNELVFALLGLVSYAQTAEAIAHSVIEGTRAPTSPDPSKSSAPDPLVAAALGVLSLSKRLRSGLGASLPPDREKYGAASEVQVHSVSPRELLR